MLIDLPRVTTSRAAQIVDIGYEGLRSYLKALGRVGMLAPFYAPEAEAKPDPAPRVGWNRIGYADLCLMRTIRVLTEAGFTFETAKSIVSIDGQGSLWSKFAHDEEPTIRFLLAWRPYGDHSVYDASTLDLLAKDLAAAESTEFFVLINLMAIQHHVIERMLKTEGQPTQLDAAQRQELPEIAAIGGNHQDDHSQALCRSGL